MDEPISDRQTSGRALDETARAIALKTCGIAGGDGAVENE
jgi:hypothetical protein